MNYFSRCPKCRGVNDAGADSCYLCGYHPLIVACRICGTRLGNPFRNYCQSCGADYFLPLQHARDDLAGTHEAGSEVTGESGESSTSKEGDLN
jgi:hypothetical protein